MDIRKNFFMYRVVSHWNRLDGVTSPAGVQGMMGCGSQCHGLFDNVVFGQRLDSMLAGLFQPKCIRE